MAVELEFFIDDVSGRHAGADADAFAVLYERTYHPLVDYCRRLGASPADAEEIAQETLTLAWASFHQYSPARPFWPWIATIARRVAIDRVRRADRAMARRHAEARVDDRVDPTPEEQLVQGDERRMARAAMSQLRPQQQRVISMRDLDGLSYEDIAASEGVTVESVRGSLRRAREALRSAYGQLAGSALGAALLPRGRMFDRLRAVSQRFGASGSQTIGDIVACLTVAALAAPGAVVVERRVTDGAATATTTALSAIAPAPDLTVAPATATTGVARGRVASTAPAPQATVALGGAARPEEKAISAMTLSPRFADDGTVFATGHDATGCVTACLRLFRSTDGGATWTPLASRGLAGERILLPPSFPDDGRIFAAGDSALQVSYDDGASFVVLHRVGSGAAMSPDFSGRDPRILIGTAPGWEYHDDYGDVRPLSLVPPPTAPINTFSFSPEHAVDGRLFIGTTVGSQPARSAVTLCRDDVCDAPVPLLESVGAPEVSVSRTFSEDGVAMAWTRRQAFRSVDGGRSFVGLGLPGTGVVRAVVSAGDGTWFVGMADERPGERGGGLFRSIDDGLSWTPVAETTPLHHGVASVVTSGATVIASPSWKPGGIWCSTDHGRTWSRRCSRG